ncbi:MAG: hypothetical protein J5725_09430, partial [Bacteroidales bacterium]|nr:hypothetical protein [Bacteroidales bacterium]
MIPVSNNLKNAVINEEMPKTLTVESILDEQLPLLNWYKTDTPPYEQTSSHHEGTLPSGSYSLSIYNDLLSVDDINYDFIDSEKYTTFVVSVQVLISSISGDLSSRRLAFYPHLLDSDNNWVYPDFYPTIPAEQCIGKWVRFYAFFSKTKLIECGANSLENCITVLFSGSYFNSLSYDIWITKPHVYYATGQVERPYSNITATADNYKKYIADYDYTFSNANILSESFSFEESVCSADQFKLGGCETNKLELTAFDIPQIPIGSCFKAMLSINGKGKFTFWDFFVKSVEKSSKGGTVLKKITAYNLLDNLSENAYAWYSQYMFGMNLVRQAQYANYHFDFERQIFSTYWNLTKSFEIENDEKLYIKTKLASFTPVDEKISDLYFDVVDNVGADQYGRVHLSKKTYTPNYNYHALRVEVDTDMLYSDMVFYKTYYDSLGRGVADLASIYITFHLSGGGEQGFLLDNGDLVLIPDDCTSYDIYVPYSFCKPNFTDSHIFATKVYLYGVEHISYDPNDVLNMKEPLPYYSYVWRKPTVDNICRASSYITARDVLRSL